jgi:hypothetical protein
MRLTHALALSTALLVVPVGVAQATAPPSSPPPAPETSAPPETSLAPAGEPVSHSGVTVTILGVHPSEPANAVVVVAEVATEIELSGSTPAIYVTASGQQVQSDAFFAIASTVFPGVSKLVAWSFGTSEVEGTVHWTVYGADGTPIEFLLMTS